MVFLLTLDQVQDIGRIPPFFFNPNLEIQIDFGFEDVFYLLSGFGANSFYQAAVSADDDFSLVVLFYEYSGKNVFSGPAVLTFRAILDFIYIGGGDKGELFPNMMEDLFSYDF